MNKRLFYYNKTNYILRLKPEAEKHFSPKSILQMGINLPFFIPFKDGINVTYKVNKDELCHYRFSSYEHIEKIYTGAYDNEATEQKIHRTRVEMVYISRKLVEKKECNAIFLSEKFNLLLGKLNNIIISYVITTKDINVTKVKRQNLDPVLIYNMIEVSKYDKPKSGLFNLNFNKLDQSRQLLSHDQTGRIMMFIDTIEEKLNPFAYSQELNLNAHLHYKNGDFRQAIIDAQTSVETFLTLLLKELLKAEKIPDKEINHKIELIAFKNMVMHHFQKRIGGDFNIKGNFSPVGKWWKEAYLLRNKIVHEGYFPSSIETENAMDSVVQLYKYIINLIHEDKIKEKYSMLPVYLPKNF
ncbi:hypothetical protein ASG99_12365 [Bacillus sp. Soil768D1]|nr:hypothetical protein ASG99_12365 [Bacillus sp. Soil768D1]